MSEKSVAENVLKWGTGGINIDGCRIEGAYGTGQNEIIEGKQSGVMYHNYDGDTKPASGHKNKIMVGNYNDKGGASRFFYIPKVSKKERNMGLDGFEDKVFNVVNGGFNSRDENGNKLRADGSIIPPLKVKNNHPTLKPVYRDWETDRKSVV